MQQGGGDPHEAALRRQGVALRGVAEAVRARHGLAFSHMTARRVLADLEVKAMT